MPFTQPITQGLDTLANETDLNVFLSCAKQRLIVIRAQIERLNQAPFAAQEANWQCLYMQLLALKSMIAERLCENLEHQCR